MNLNENLFDWFAEYTSTVQGMHYFSAPKKSIFFLFVQKTIGNLIIVSRVFSL